MKLGTEVIGAQSAVASIDPFEDIRQALQQALSETLARITARENLEGLLSQLVQERAFADATRLPAPVARYGMLTAREQEILKCIAAGYSNKVIARTFDLSVHTVKRHVANILGKLGVSSRTEAAKWIGARH